MNHIVSHTICKNSMPFIGLVLKQVEPYMDKMFITVSEHSTDGTRAILETFKDTHPQKVVLDTEKVYHPSELTRERQKQVEKTSDGDWILFLDDDDYWSDSSLQKMKELPDTPDAYAFNPYQLVGKITYDDSWRNKWFTKLFRKTPELHYEGGWPRDLIFNGKDILYWRKNEKVVRVPIRFIHLSYLKNYSFRTEDWAKEYKDMIGKTMEVPLELYADIDKIYEQIKQY